MIIITKREMLQSVAERWRIQYSPISKATKDKRSVYRKLKQLDTDTCTAEQINKIIGNDCWTDLTCHECGKNVNMLVQLGEQPDYESCTADICLDCIAEASKMIADKYSGVN